MSMSYTKEREWAQCEKSLWDKLIIGATVGWGPNPYWKRQGHVIAN